MFCSEAVWIIGGAVGIMLVCYINGLKFNFTDFTMNRILPYAAILPYSPAENKFWNEHILWSFIRCFGGIVRYTCNV